MLKRLTNTTRYDVDRVRSAALITTPLDRLILRETPKGKLQIAIEEPKISFLQVSCDAPDVHPVDGVPEIAADGESFATITVERFARGNHSKPIRITTCSTCAPTTAALFSDDGHEEINTIKLRGVATFRLVSKGRGAWRPSRFLMPIPISRTTVFASNLLSIRQRL